MDKMNNVVAVGGLIAFAFLSLWCINKEKKRADMLQEKLDGVTLQMNMVNDNLYNINKKIDNIEETQEQYKQDFDEYRDQIKSKFDNVFDRIHNVNEHVNEVEQSKAVQKQQNYVAESYTASASTDSGYDHDFKSAGWVEDGEYRYTWYSQRVLPGGGLDIPGRHVDEDGFVRDEDGNLCIAARDIEKGSEVDTPYGKAIVYDYCPNDNLDIYTDW